MLTALESTPLTCTRSEEGIVSIHLSSPSRPVVILDADLLRRLDTTLDALLECARQIFWDVGLPAFAMDEWMGPIYGGPAWRPHTFS